MNTQLKVLLRIACLGLLAASPGAVAPVHAQPPSASPPPPVVQVVDVSADKQDLVIKMQWSETEPLPPSASLVISSTDGTVRANQPLSPASGDAEVVVPAVLTTQDIGAFLQASVVDAAQAPLSSLPFDLVLSCDNPVDCHLQARPGVAAAPGSQVISQAMDAALHASLSSTARLQPDVLGDVMARNPALIGETYTYGVTVAKAVPLLPINLCFCKWNTVFLPSPPAGVAVSSDLDPVHQRGWQGPGAAHSLRAWYDGGLGNQTHDTETSVESQSQATMKLDCLYIKGWKLIVITIFGHPYYIYVPIIESSCPGCTGTVDNYAEYYADTSASVDAGWFGSGAAAAQEEGLFSVNGQAVINRISRVGKEVKKQWGFSLTIAGLGSITEDNGNVTVNGTPSWPFKAEIKYEVNGNDGFMEKKIVSSGFTTVVQPAMALFRSKALVYAKGSSDTDSEGKSNMSYFYAMHGRAQCAIPTDTAFWDSASYNNRTPQLKTNIKNFFSGYGVLVNP